MQKENDTFTFQGREYHYFYHEYNTTWGNERAIEIPIVYQIVKEYGSNSVLEVGNVLSHYFGIAHEVLDKYEQGEGVINQDVVDFHTPKKYDLIVSISTLEHIGWDEKPRAPEKVLSAFENLRALLDTQGKMVATLPIGYNPRLDKYIWEREISFSEQYYLKRISRDNKWREVSRGDVQNAKYGNPFPAANGVVVGVVKKHITQVKNGD